MREIKFQHIWTNDKQFSTYVSTLKEIEEGGLPSVKFDGKSAKLIARRQFTGMKNGDGIDIYEDDIFVDDDCDCEFGSARFGLVKYDESQAKFIVVDWRGENQGDLDEWQSAPIVGNIHQQPNLMG